MKKTLLILLFLGIAAAAVGLYFYFKPTASVANEKPEFSISAEQLVADFEKDEKAANEKYLGKVIELSGTVSEKSFDSNGILNITLAGEEIAGVTCQMFKENQPKASGVHEGAVCKIKGRCTGILMDVILVDCVIE
jgi:hypothetical protein